MVIMYWLSNQHLQIDPQLLWQMRNFCDSAIRMKSSSTMVDKARDLLCQIDVRVSFDFLAISQSLICKSREASTLLPCHCFFLLAEGVFKRPKSSQMSWPSPLLCWKETSTKS